MKNFNFKITLSGNIKHMSVSAHNLISAYQEVREIYLEGRIILL